MDHLYFSTAEIATSGRPGSWEQINRDYFGDLRVDGLEDVTVDASFSVYEVGALRMFLIDAPAHRIYRDDALTQPTTHDLYKLVLQLSGHSEIRQRDKSLLLNQGDWSLYDPCVPYTITNYEPCTLLVVQIPKKQLKSFKVPNLHTCEAGSSSQAGIYCVLGSFLKSLAEQLPTLSNGVAQPIGETVLGLLASTLASYQHDGTEHSALPDVLKARIKQYVQTHLCEADLTIDRIAADMRCSKRYLHRVFQGEVVSLDRYIWLARLERCRVALCAPSLQAKSISEIAFAWGFNSSAHFCRLFKSHYKVSPGAFQRESTLLQKTVADLKH